MTQYTLDNLDKDCAEAAAEYVKAVALAAKCLADRVEKITEKSESLDKTMVEAVMQAHLTKMQTMIDQLSI